MISSKSKEKLIYAAKQYFDFGFECLPVRIKIVNGKKEIVSIPQWSKQTFSQNKFISLINRGFYNTLAIKTGQSSGLFIFDMDITDCKEAKLFFKNNKIEIPPDTPVSKTQSGGYHLWFRMPVEEMKGGSDHKNKIDWRGSGGLIFAPPSDFGNNRKYIWLIPIEPDKSNLRTPPEKLLEWILSHKKETQDETKEHGNKTIWDITQRQRECFLQNVNKCATAKKGIRNQIDFSTMMYGLKIGLSENELKKFLQDVGKFQGRPDYFRLTYQNTFFKFKQRGN